MHTLDNLTQVVNNSTSINQTNLIEYGFPAINRRYKQCYRCDELVFYDASVKSSKGRIIPREKRTGLIHNCLGMKVD